MMADPDDTSLSGDAFAILARAHPNVLLIGPVDATDQALALISRYLLRPTVFWTPRETRDLPQVPYGTLVINAIETADATQLSHLVARLDGGAEPVQVVCTTPTPLFPLVVRGAFPEPLYYLLNQVCFDWSAA
jgi:hypothetical protein